MGQTRTVTVVKYVTEKTVEQVRRRYHLTFPEILLTVPSQNIVALQRMKSRLAKFSLDSTTDENATGSLDVRNVNMHP